MESSEITLVKQVAAILYQEKEDFDNVLPVLKETFSEVDYIGEFYSFVETDYYEMEMGAGLKRGIISFSGLVHPETLVKSKHLARRLEDNLRKNGNRKINIDVGYLDLFKVVLASFKGRSNKIYMSDGVWADMILYFEGGDYKSFIWGFPDFKSGIYDNDLKEIRTAYKLQLRKVKS